MSDGLSATIVGTEAVVRDIGDKGSRVHAELLKAVDLSALKLAVRVKNKLSGDVLKVRTGRLRRSITSKTTDSPTAISAVVGTTVVYARFQELGFSGMQNVAASLRTIKTAFGKAIKGGSVTFPVRAHTRRVDYPAHSFLASSMAEEAPEFQAAIAQAVARGLK